MISPLQSNPEDRAGIRLARLINEALKTERSEAPSPKRDGARPKEDDFLSALLRCLFRSGAVFAEILSRLNDGLECKQRCRAAAEHDAAHSITQLLVSEVRIGNPTLPGAEESDLASSSVGRRERARIYRTAADEADDSDSDRDRTAGHVVRDTNNLVCVLPRNRIGVKSARRWRSQAERIRPRAR